MTLAIVGLGAAGGVIAAIGFARFLAFADMPPDGPNPVVSLTMMTVGLVMFVAALMLPGAGA